MKKEIEKFVYGGSEIEFDLSGGEIMINATEMAKIFGKKTSHFLDNDQTQAFIDVLCESRNSAFDKIVKVVKGGKNGGTWMNQVLALKFAAWLNPRFELWVYDVIQKIMFGDNLRVRSNQEQLHIITERIKEIDQTASVIMKERWQLIKQKEIVEADTYKALGIKQNVNLN